jgi:hypothetical protein
VTIKPRRGRTMKGIIALVTVSLMLLAVCVAAATTA